MKHIKRDFLWTSLYNGIIGVFSSLMLLICVRLNGVILSGKFIIILTTVTLLSLISEYGLRVFQVTDIKRKYSFSDYFVTKFFLLIIVVFVSLIFLIFKHYNINELLIFINLLVIKSIDNLSELFQGELQLQKKLFLTSKYAFIRVLLYLLTFVITDLITRNIVLSSILMMFMNVILFVVFDLIILKGNKQTIKIGNSNIKLILKQCFPLFLTTILNMYIINFVKYILDIYELYGLQTYYNIIYITMFVLNLITIFIIKPLLEPLTNLYQKKDIHLFKKYILRIVVILCIFALLLELVFCTFGTNLLSIIYSVDVSIYKTELCIMIIGSLFYAITTLLQSILTIMRKQKQLVFVYILISIFCLLLTCGLKNITMYKVVWANNIVMFILLILSSFLVLKELYLVKFYKLNHTD